jgi:capsular polysaccharide biosynthesis protein
VLTLEQVWPQPKAAGLELLWAEQFQPKMTRDSIGGLVAAAGEERATPIAPRVPKPMLPAAVVRATDVLLTNRGGVTLHTGDQIGGAALGTSVDVCAGRFFETVREDPATLPEGILLAQPGDQVFGHQLLDLVPRILAARIVAPPETPFIVSAVAKDSFRKLLNQLGLDDTVLVALPLEESVATRVSRLLLVTGARQDARLDPARLKQVQDIGRSCCEPSPTNDQYRTFLTRRHLPPPQIHNRPLANRAEVEDEFTGLGFNSVAPEVKGLAEIAELVEATETLAGEDGSALHNVLWGPQRLLCLGHPANMRRPRCDLSLLGWGPG